MLSAQARVQFSEHEAVSAIYLRPPEMQKFLNIFLFSTNRHIYLPDQLLGFSKSSVQTRGAALAHASDSSFSQAPQASSCHQEQLAARQEQCYKVTDACGHVASVRPEVPEFAIKGNGCQAGASLQGN